MDPKLYSETLEPLTGEITNARLSRSIAQLTGLYQVGQLLKWDENRIAIPVQIPVELPPLGNIDDLDIRPVEPVLLVVNPATYPTVAPDSYPDRLDFPVQRLAHFYMAKEGRPAEFCLTRGAAAGLNEWYANKQMKDLGIRVSNWLRDAAAGTLTENADQFEPLRLEGYSGTLMYDYDAIADTVNSPRSFNEGENFSLALFEWYGDDFNWKFCQWITPDNVDQVRTEVFAEALKDGTPATKRFLYPGYILWSTGPEKYNAYNIHLPGTWGELKEFCRTYGIDTAPFEDHLVANDLRFYYYVPIIVTIRRPKPVIGYSGDLEFINFHVRIENEKISNGKVDDGSEVNFKQHKQPITAAKATEMSGFPADLKGGALLAGCGALGARIALNLAKCGSLEFLPSDPGRFSAHNFLRHPLSASYNGVNKARAMEREIRKMYDGTNIVFYSYGKSAQLALVSANDEFTYSWIYDFTASTVFLNDLVNADISPSTRIARAYITNFGDIGVLLLEGQSRNPRIDDLLALLYAQSATHEDISRWLRREVAAPRNSSFIQIGIGCHTETTVLSSEYVDLHASLITGNIKIATTQPQSANGKVQIQIIDRQPIFQARPMAFEFQPLFIFKAMENDWQVRMASGLIERMQQQMRAAAPHETGGVFIGCANYKTRVIHVVDLIDAPPDSRANEVCFIRGIEGLPNALQQIQDRSGGQLGYIGEWHSHPHGPEWMSTTDHATVSRFHRIYRDFPTPLPVFLMIITPNNILPFVFD